MTTPTLKIKITPASKLRGKMDVRFPANVEASAPILLDKSGGAYTFSFDANSLSSTFATAAQGALADTAIQSVVAGSNVTVDNTDPRNPVVSASASGTGDFSSNTSSSVDGEIVLFSGTGGKTGKRATGSGLAKLTSGVLSAASSGTDYAPATSGTSILKGNGSGGFSSASAGTDYQAADAQLFSNIPQNSQSAAYTLVAADAQKHIYHPSADTTARVWTIPANASVAFPIGTTVVFINDTSGGAITIAITSDTLVLAGAGTTGSRTLAANGMATAVKMTSTRWMISGTGLT